MGRSSLQVRSRRRYAASASAGAGNGVNARAMSRGDRGRTRVRGITAAVASCILTEAATARPGLSGPPPARPDNRTAHGCSVPSASSAISAPGLLRLCLLGSAPLADSTDPASVSTSSTACSTSSACWALPAARWRGLLSTLRALSVLGDLSALGVSQPSRRPSQPAARRAWPRSAAQRRGPIAS